MIVKQICLNPFEATAYFWVSTIKNKVRELSINDSENSKKEIDFLNIFYDYTDIEWRKLYLELSNYIQDKVNKYVPHGMYGIDEYNQDTAEFYHNDINEVLSDVSSTLVPDIKLARKGLIDTIISTNNYGANKYYGTYGITPLSSTYESNYILTGNKKELDFYNLAMAVTTVVCQKNKSFHSIDSLRNIFCDIYIEIYGEIDRKILEEQFNYVFYQMHDKGLVLGNYLRHDFNCNFNCIDFIGLDSYIDEVNQKIIIRK